MENLLNFTKKHSQIIILIAFSLLILLSFFVKQASLCVMFLMLCLTMFLKTETIYLVLFYIFPFQVLLSYPLGGMVYLIMILGLLGIIKNYIFDILKNGKKISYKIYIIFAILLVYIIFIPKIKGAFPFMLFMVNSLLAIFALEYKDEINFTKFVETMSFALILSGILWIFRDYSEPIKSYEYVIGDIIRFSGCFEHPNIYGFYSIFALSSLFFLFYKKQINYQKFLLLYLGCFIFGYMTLSRNFLLNIVIANVILFIFLIKRDGLKSFEFILPYMSLILIICLLMTNTTDGFINMFKNSYEVGNLTDNELKLFNNLYYNEILAGKVKYDPGRLGLWEIYLEFLFNNPKCLVFGRGYGIFKIGQMGSHNLIISYVYYFGIVGLILFAVFIFAILGGKKLFKIFRYSEIFIVVIPFVIYMGLNPLSIDMLFTLVLLFLGLQDKRFELSEQDKMFEKINENKIIKYSYLKGKIKIL